MTGSSVLSDLPKYKKSFEAQRLTFMAFDKKVDLRSRIT